MLCAEGEAEPGVDELGVGRRHERVVLVAPAGEPLLGGDRVQIPDELRLAHGVARVFHPHVRAPGLVGTMGSEQVADELAVADRGRAGPLVQGPERLDLPAIVEAGGQARLNRALAVVALLEQGRGSLDVLLGERLNLRAPASPQDDTVDPCPRH